LLDSDGKSRVIHLFELSIFGIKKGEGGGVGFRGIQVVMSTSFISLELMIVVSISEPLICGRPSPIYRYRIRVYMSWALMTWQRGLLEGWSDSCG
jgi:hypothetical protein